MPTRKRCLQENTKALFMIAANKDRIMRKQHQTLMRCIHEANKNIKQFVDNQLKQIEVVANQLYSDIIDYEDARDRIEETYVGYVYSDEIKKENAAMKKAAKKKAK